MGFSKPAVLSPSMEFDKLTKYVIFRRKITTTIPHAANITLLWKMRNIFVRISLRKSSNAALLVPSALARCNLHPFAGGTIIEHMYVPKTEFWRKTIGTCPSMLLYESYDNFEPFCSVNKCPSRRKITQHRQLFENTLRKYSLKNEECICLNFDEKKLFGGAFGTREV